MTWDLQSRNISFQLQHNFWPQTNAISLSWAPCIWGQLYSGQPTVNTTERKKKHGMYQKGEIDKNKCLEIRTLILNEHWMYGRKEYNFRCLYPHRKNKQQKYKLHCTPHRWSVQSEKPNL